MKIRTTHNSIRYRLRKSEIDKLKNDGVIAESISFPSGQALKSELHISDEIKSCEAAFDGNSIKLSLPTDLAKLWINTNQVGIEEDLALPDGTHLHILIEKDFPCLDRPNEDKSDTFWELADKAVDSC
jgi:hypothetical protein